MLSRCHKFALGGSFKPGGVSHDSQSYLETISCSIGNSIYKSSLSSPFRRTSRFFLPRKISSNKTCRVSTKLTIPEFLFFPYELSDVSLVLYGTPNQVFTIPFATKNKKVHLLSTVRFICHNLLPFRSETVSGFQQSRSSSVQTRQTAASGEIAILLASK